jgi:hypothetical protein
MKRWSLIAVLMLGGVTMAGGANAGPINFTDTFNPSDVYFSGSIVCTGSNGAIDTTSASTCGVLSWSHALDGFNPLTDSLLSSTLTLWVNDDDDQSAEKFDLTMDTLSIANHWSSPTAGFNVLSEMADGALNVTLARQNGVSDFYFLRAELTAAGERGPASTENVELAAVPEPASLVLFGSGLAALAARRRRKK